LINFAGQSIPLAYLKITLQKNALGADRYIVMKSVDDFSTRPFTGPKNGVGKTSYIMNVYNVWQFFAEYSSNHNVDLWIPLFNEMP
jgi:hypothetical protein